MTDWLMVIITAIYVVATIFICRANIKSAEATREQLAESKRQFDEDNRAFVTISFEVIRGGLAVLCIENHGKRIANNVSVRIAQEFLDNMDEDSAKELTTKLCQSSFQLGVGKKLYAFLGSHLDLKKLSKVPLTIDINYQDSVKEYAEKTVIDLSQYLWSLMYNSVAADTQKEIASIAKSIKSIDKKYSIQQRTTAREKESLNVECDDIK